MSGPKIDELLEDYRNAEPGGHLVGGGVLRALCAEIDRLRAPLPDSTALESAAEELRAGTPHWMRPGEPGDWRNRVADWLEKLAGSDGR